MSTVTTQTARAALTVEPLSPVIGAQVDGALLSELDDGALARVREALVEHKVLFFRGQHLAQDQQVAFARRLGALTGGHPTLPSSSGSGYVLELDSLAGGRADHWHTDVTFALEPPAISVLRAVKVPAVGGDTQWANTEAAYQRLPGPLQHLANELHAVHTNGYDYGRPPAGEESEAARRHRQQFVNAVFETEHPVVRLHPETGRPSLLLGGFAQRVVGFPPDASRDLLRIFHSFVVRPEHIVRWHWQTGDVAIWDNRATQHYAVNDYGDAHRVVQRVTVSGPRPVGPDGWRSVALKGDNAAYQAGVGAGKDN